MCIIEPECITTTMFGLEKNQQEVQSWQPSTNGLGLLCYTNVAPCKKRVANVLTAQHCSDIHANGEEKQTFA